MEVTVLENGETLFFFSGSFTGFTTVEGAADTVLEGDVLKLDIKKQKGLTNWEVLGCVSSITLTSSAVAGAVVAFGLKQGHVDGVEKKVLACSAVFYEEDYPHHPQENETR